MTPWELAAFAAGLEPAADRLRGVQPTTPHPTGMTDIWLAAASRLPESAMLAAVRELANTQNVKSIWRQATPLLMAVSHAGHFRVADQLLKAGADPNQGTSILHASCDWHFEHLIPALRYMSEAGWDVNSCDSSGQTALHKAAFLGYACAVRTLLECVMPIHASWTLRGTQPFDVARSWKQACGRQGSGRAQRSADFVQRSGRFHSDSNPQLPTKGPVISDEREHAQSAVLLGTEDRPRDETGAKALDSGAN